MGEDIAENKTPQESKLWLLPGCLLNSFHCLICGQKEQCSYTNIFQTTTCRQRRLFEFLSSVLLTNIDIDTTTSQVICEPCKELADRAEILELKLEYIHIKLRKLHRKTLQHARALDADVQIVSSRPCKSLDDPSEIPIKSLESRRKTRKDKLVPRMELSPEPEEQVKDAKRKRGRPRKPQEIRDEKCPSKKTKSDNITKTPLLKPSVLLLASTSSSINISEPPDALNQFGDQFSQSIKVQQNIDEVIVHDKKKNGKINVGETLDVKKDKVLERSKQVKRMADWFDSRLRKKVRVQELKSLEETQKTEMQASIAEKEVSQNYELIKNPDSTNLSASLILKFKRKPEDKVNYNETFDSDSDNYQDTKHKDPDYKHHKKTFSVKIKTRRTFGCFTSENVDKRKKKKKKKKHSKKTGKPNIDRTQLDKENTCQPALPIANDMNKKTDNEKVCGATGNDKKRETGEHKSFKNIIKKKMKITGNAVSKHHKPTVQELSTACDSMKNKTLNSSLSTNTDKSSNNSLNDESINPLWVQDDYNFHEELIIKDEPRDDEDELFCANSSSSKFSRINFKTDIINDEDEFSRDYILSQTIKTEPTDQIKEEVLDSMCAKMESMFPSSRRNSYLQYNCNEGQFKTSAHQIWSSDAVKFKTPKVEEIEYFCDICGEDFNSVELLGHHIEVDHFSPTY